MMFDKYGPKGEVHAEQWKTTLKKIHPDIVGFEKFFQEYNKTMNDLKRLPRMKNGRTQPNSNCRITERRKFINKRKKTQ
jgi:hypothetical protein